MIVVEGPDNGGKTSLANRFGLPIFTAGPAPRTEAEVTRCIDQQYGRATLPCVQDRLTLISHQVYPDEGPSELLSALLRGFVELQGVVIVYCRPPNRTLMDFSHHSVKSYDTEESLKRIYDNQHRYIERYDDIMSHIPHIEYDWTSMDRDSTDEFVGRLLATQGNPEGWRKFRRDGALWVPR